VALLALAIGACGVLIVSPRPSRSPTGFVLIVLATAAGLLVLREERRGRGPTLRMVVVAVALLGLVAVVYPPRGSNDAWTYVMYGRTVAVHHASPYTHVPADFPKDPFLYRTGPRWRHTPAVYGPVFAAYAAIGAWMAGNSFLLARLFHQVLALAALAAVLAVVWRRTRSPAALALIGLHPAIMVSTVNGGHNDLFVGLLILVGVVLALSERPALAGAILGVAACVKITAGLAAVGLAIWYLRERGWTMAWRFSRWTAAVVVLLYLPVGWVAVTAMGTNKNLMSRASAWQLPRHLLGLDHGQHVAMGLNRSDVIGVLASVATACAVLIGIVLAWRLARHGAQEAALLPTASYQVGAAYTLPWYSAWALPLAALRPHSLLTQLLAIHAGFLAAAYSLPRGLPALPWFPDERVMIEYVLPLAILAAFVLGAWLRARRHPIGDAPPALPQA